MLCENDKQTVPCMNYKFEYLQMYKSLGRDGRIFFDYFMPEKNWLLILYNLLMLVLYYFRQLLFVNCI
jgi:hypothetical protein